MAPPVVLNDWYATISPRDKQGRELCCKVVGEIVDRETSAGVRDVEVRVVVRQSNERFDGAWEKGLGEFRLEGRPSLDKAEQAGITEDQLTAFSTGIPKNWTSLLEKAASRRLSSSATSRPSHNPTPSTSKLPRPRPRPPRHTNVSLSASLFDLGTGFQPKDGKMKSARTLAWVLKDRKGKGRAVEDVTIEDGSTWKFRDEGYRPGQEKTEKVKIGGDQVNVETSTKPVTHNVQKELSTERMQEPAAEPLDAGAPAPDPPSTSPRYSPLRKSTPDPVPSRSPLSQPPNDILPQPAGDTTPLIHTALTALVTSFFRRPLPSLTATEGPYVSFVPSLSDRERILLEKALEPIHLPPLPPQILPQLLDEPKLPLASPQPVSPSNVEDDSTEVSNMLLQSNKGSLQDPQPEISSSQRDVEIPSTTTELIVPSQDEANPQSPEAVIPVAADEDEEMAVEEEKLEVDGSHREGEGESEEPEFKSFPFLLSPNTTGERDEIVPIKFDSSSPSPSPSPTPPPPAPVVKVPSPPISPLRNSSLDPVQPLPRSFSFSSLYGADQSESDGSIDETMMEVAEFVAKEAMGLSSDQAGPSDGPTFARRRPPKDLPATTNKAEKVKEKSIELEKYEDLAKEQAIEKEKAEEPPSNLSKNDVQVPPPLIDSARHSTPPLSPSIIAADSDPLDEPVDSNLAVPPTFANPLPSATLLDPLSTTPAIGDEVEGLPSPANGSVHIPSPVPDALPNSPTQPPSHALLEEPPVDQPETLASTEKSRFDPSAWPSVEHAKTVEMTSPPEERLDKISAQPISPLSRHEETTIDMDKSLPTAEDDLEAEKTVLGELATNSKPANNDQPSPNASVEIALEGATTKEDVTSAAEHPVERSRSEIRNDEITPNEGLSNTASRDLDATEEDGSGGEQGRADFVENGTGVDEDEVRGIDGGDEVKPRQAEEAEPEPGAINQPETVESQTEEDHSRPVEAASDNSIALKEDLANDIREASVPTPISPSTLLRDDASEEEVSETDEAVASALQALRNESNSSSPSHLNYFDDVHNRDFGGGGSDEEGEIGLFPNKSPLDETPIEAVQTTQHAVSPRPSPPPPMPVVDDDARPASQSPRTIRSNSTNGPVKKHQRQRSTFIGVEIIPRSSSKRSPSKPAPVVVTAPSLSCNPPAQSSPQIAAPLPSPPPRPSPVQPAPALSPPALVGDVLKPSPFECDQDLAVGEDIRSSAESAIKPSRKRTRSASMSSDCSRSQPVEEQLDVEALQPEDFRSPPSRRRPPPKRRSRVAQSPTVAVDTPKEEEELEEQPEVDLELSRQTVENGKAKSEPLESALANDEEEDELGYSPAAATSRIPRRRSVSFGDDLPSPRVTHRHSPSFSSSPRSPRKLDSPDVDDQPVTPASESFAARKARLAGLADSRKLAPSTPQIASSSKRRRVDDETASSPRTASSRPRRAPKPVDGWWEVQRGLESAKSVKMGKKRAREDSEEEDDANGEYGSSVADDSKMEHEKDTVEEEEEAEDEQSEAEFDLIVSPKKQDRRLKKPTQRLSPQKPVVASKKPHRPAKITKTPRTPRREETPASEADNLDDEDHVPSPTRSEQSQSISPQTNRASKAKSSLPKKRKKRKSGFYRPRKYTPKQDRTVVEPEMKLSRASGVKAMRKAEAAQARLEEEEEEDEQDRRKPSSVKKKQKRKSRAEMEDEE